MISADDLLSSDRPCPAAESFLRQAALWSLPALAMGAFLRIALLSYAPYAFWESDSNSYFGFAHQLFYHGDFSIDSKRRYLYPIFVGLLNVLPGSVMGWLALTQHLLGLAATVALGYVVRGTCAAWRWWIVPVTLIYAGLPIVIWFEHAALGETLFISALTLAFGGWVAWLRAPRDEPAFSRKWWLFFVPFAVALLTKSAGRFIWPGFAAALFLFAARRHFRRTQTLWLTVLFLLSLTAGSGSQGSWMLAASSFPLIRTDAPGYEKYKAEIAPLVREKRANLDTFYAHDDDTKKLVRDPETAKDMPNWQSLAKGQNRQAKLKMYRTLALDGILHAPQLMSYISLQRVVASANMSQFKESRLEGDYGGRTLAAAFGADIPPDENVMRLVLGLGKGEPVPPMDQIRERMSPRPDSTAARWVLGYTLWFDGISRLFTPDSVFAEGRPISEARPTVLCLWLLAGMALAMALPAYRTTLGVWALIALSYIFGTYAVGSANPRFFVVWPLLCPFLAVPADALIRWIKSRRAAI